MANTLPIAPFDDRPVVIVAGGPSLTLAQVRIVGIARARDKCRVIAVNDAVYPCWYADVAYAGDERFWRYHQGVPGFRGLKLAIQETRFRDVRALENAGAEYTGNEGLKIGHWKNSGAQAVQVAADKLYAKQIFLLAFDYSGSKDAGDGTRDHWFGRHVDQPEFRMDINSDVGAIKRLFRILTDHLQARGVEIVNCSPESTVDWLPRSSIEREFPL